MCASRAVNGQMENVTMKVNVIILVPVHPYVLRRPHNCTRSIHTCLWYWWWPLVIFHSLLSPFVARRDIPETWGSIFVLVWSWDMVPYDEHTGAVFPQRVMAVPASLHTVHFARYCQGTRGRDHVNIWHCRGVVDIVVIGWRNTITWSQMVIEYSTCIFFIYFDFQFSKCVSKLWNWFSKMPK